MMLRTLLFFNLFFDSGKTWKQLKLGEINQNHLRQLHKTSKK